MLLQFQDKAVLSYIKKYRSIDLVALQSELNMPLNGIVEVLTWLLANDYIRLSDNETDEYEILDQNIEHLPEWEEIQDRIEYVDIPPFEGPYNSCGFPQIDTEETLNKLTKSGKIQLNRQYHNFTLFNGKKGRLINAPSKQLKRSQRWILDNILTHSEIDSCVHGFVVGRSILTNAKAHIGKKEIMCIDIKDFFPSIKIERVQEVFARCGYSEAVSKRLAKLCTYQNCLPQGAPTSPMIANLVLSELDNQMMRLSERYGCIYTRYADDITLSWNNEGIDALYCEIVDIVKQSGFTLNDNKTRIMTGNTRKVTGLLVRDDTIKIPKKYKRKMEQDIYYCEKYGVTEHLQKTHQLHRVNFKEYMYGRAYFIAMVEPALGNDYLDRLDVIFSFPY